jgi:hypothetical protein
MHNIFSYMNCPAEIKGFLSDVKPALLSALDAEYEKNPFEVCCVSDCLECVSILTN